MLIFWPENLDSAGLRGSVGLRRMTLNLSSAGLRGLIGNQGSKLATRGCKKASIKLEVNILTCLVMVQDKKRKQLSGRMSKKESEEQ